MMFPVRMITSLPFRAATADDDLFDDLATMHIERVGLRPDENAGQLTDTFVIDQGEEETRLLTVVLCAPAEGELPLRSPKEFDLSARALPLPENGVAIVARVRPLGVCDRRSGGRADLLPGDLLRGRPTGRHGGRGSATRADPTRPAGVPARSRGRWWSGPTDAAAHRPEALEASVARPGPGRSRDRRSCCRRRAASCCPRTSAPPGASGPASGAGWR